jgi:putative efflux protein, MATE family
VGSTSSLINLLINLFVGCATGTNILISRFIAREEEKQSREAVSTALLFSLAGGVVLIAIGYLFTKPLLVLMGSPEDVIDLSAVYLKIYFLGMPFLMLYNFGSAVLRAKGDTRRPLFALTIAGVVNVAFNVFFVAFLDMGVAGVGVATVISEAISSALIVWFLIREEGYIKFDLRHIVFMARHLKSIVSIGLPAGLQGVVFSVSNVCIQSGINSLGSSVMAGSAAAGNYENFSYFIVTAFVQSAITFASQNYAFGSEERTKRAYHEALLLSIGTMIVFDFLVFAFRYPALSIFTDDPEVTHFAVIKFCYTLLPHCLISLYEITAGVLRAMGKSMLPSLICIVGTCCVRLLWVAFVFPFFRDFAHLVLVYPVSWVITAIMMLTAYNREKGKLFALIKKPE